MLVGMDEIADHPSIAEAELLATATEDRRPPEPIDPEHAAIVARGREQARRGLFASAEAVDAVFRRAGL